MNISKFFIDRPIFAGVLSVLILLAGVLAMLRLPISEYPEVAPPSIVVRNVDGCYIVAIEVTSNEASG